jgi:hypothetical protein
MGATTEYTPPPTRSSRRPPKNCSALTSCPQRSVRKKGPFSVRYTASARRRKGLDPEVSITGPKWMGSPSTRL